MGVSTCGWYRKRLPLLTGAELVGQERRLVERHLLGCSACRHAYQQLQETSSILQALASSEPSPETRTGSIWPALSQQIRESRRPYPVERPWFSKMARPLAGLAAALALSAVVGWLALHLDRTKPMMGLTQMVSAKPDSKKIRRTTIVRPAPPRTEITPLSVEIDSLKTVPDTGAEQALDTRTRPAARGDQLTQ